MECPCGEQMKILFSYSSTAKGQITVWGCDCGHEEEESTSEDVAFYDDWR